MSQKDPYTILKVPPDAELSQIEAAYWRLARRYSAALGVDPEAPRLLKDLNQAYRCLTIPQLRRELDQRLARVAPARREGTQLSVIRTLSTNERVLTRAEWAAGLRASTATTVARRRRGTGLPHPPGSAPLGPGALQSPSQHPPTDSQP